MINREDIEKAIKHYKSLQKRYTTLHDGKNCEITKTTIEALERQIPKSSNPTENIGCYIFVDNRMKQIEIPEELLIELIHSIRENGSEFIRFKNETIKTNGIIVVGKNFKGTCLVYGS